ncbi:MAG: ethanolamine utilization protein EutH [Terrisporobacter sp.]|uniref:ethanolamine utilization protein EutH n=1 Tax=Terrisporobacter sp. TaxID=1965305 RepID=UPI002FC699E8
MELLGNLILYIIMACCAVGGLAKIFKEDSGLAQSFDEGLHTMATMFIPIVGLMVSVPYLKVGVEKIFGKLFGFFGADPVIAAAMIMPPDCGSYALGMEIGQTSEIIIIVLAVGFMCASTVAFNIPIGLSILDKKDYKYLALGAMSGFLAIPFAVFTSYMVAFFTNPTIRTTLSTVGDPSYTLNLSMIMIFQNLIPIIIVCLLLALGLKFFPNGMIKGFMYFGKGLTAILTIVVVSSIIQHYTGLFSKVFGVWGFDPMFADEKEMFRSIELLGSIAMMLCGAFPMVYLIRKYFKEPLEKLGSLAGLDSAGSAGIVACMANGIAIFSLVKDMNPKSKVISMSFLVCAGYSLGDFIAFNVNFQPNLVVAIFVGQIVGGLIGIMFAKLIAVPYVSKMEGMDEVAIECQ